MHRDVEGKFQKVGIVLSGKCRNGMQILGYGRRVFIP